VERTDDSGATGKGRRAARPAATPARRERPSAAERDPDLSVCGTCSSKFVQPIDWSLVGREHWRVTLRCPNCGWEGTGVFAQECVDRFDGELDRGTRELTKTLLRVTRACMEAELEQFVRALECDLIFPSDF
jgi:hypothetical protein